ncbi:MAG: nucleotidyl transferase AbiEii/AbiGii toxin family protein [Thermodesulfobacteriota bacterium]|nr:nucleotidyl transferase AbiEii/AbiGii toxin family protein [Thermodesulfobacteriota bacterium]
MIPQRNISLLSNRLARKGGRRIPENILERDYCIAWFLVGLSRSSLCNLLVFKGGTALKRCYFGDYRFSEDLDFTLAKKIPLSGILAEFENVSTNVLKDSGIIIQYSREDRRSHENSYTFYLAYEGPLPGTSLKEVKVDITINERIVLPVQEKVVLRGYDEYEDFPENAKIKVYSLEEILIEKVVALTDRARNEPRDLYDVWYLTVQENMDLSLILPEINRKLEFRERDLAGMNDELLKKETRLKKLWQTRLSYQMVALPHFDEVFRAVKRAFRNVIPL